MSAPGEYPETELILNEDGKVVGHRLVGPLPPVGRQCGRAACAWCGKDLGERAGIPQGETTHGICPDCSEVVLAEALEVHRRRCSGWRSLGPHPDVIKRGQRAPCEICNPYGTRNR